MFERDDYDAIIVGARCAGAGTALQLARRGLRVLAVDRSAYGSDTVSTHALMRGAVMQLARWGVLESIVAAGTPASRRTTFHYGETSRPIAVEPDEWVDALYAPRRQVLDAVLVDAARAAGAEVHHRCRVTGLERDRRDQVCGVTLADESGAPHTVRAPLVIGADGVRSGVARMVGAPTVRSGAHGTTGLYSYFEGLGVEGTHWYNAPGALAGAIPTNGGLTLVFVLLPPERFIGRRAPRQADFDQALRVHFPALAAGVRSGRQVTGLRVSPATTGFLRRAHGPGWALVGDAGYFKDPCTAHGITDALRDAELLAEAIVAGRPSRYEEGRNELSLPLARITDRIASFDWTLGELQELHRALSKAMRPELASLRELEATLLARAG